MSRITRIRLFPLFFHNGCSQSSRFLPQARRIVGSGDENDDRVNGLYVKAEDNNDLQNHKTPLSIFLFSESGRVGERYHSLVTFQLYNHQFMSDNRTVFTYRHGMSNYSGVAKNGHLIFLRLVGGEWCMANHLRANQSARAKSTIHLPSIY